MTLNFKILDTKEIPIDQIESGDVQVRTHFVDEDIDELAEDMKPGLIHPILVYVRDDHKYELVAGQRRLLAAKKLKWKTIRATIIEQPKDKLTSKLISYIENKARKKLSNKDTVNFVNVLYGKHNIKQVSQMLTLSQDDVRRALDMPRFPEEIRTMVTSGDISLETAKRSVDMYQWDPPNLEDSEAEIKKKEEDIKKIITMAKLMEPEPFVNIDQKKAVVDFGQSHQELPPEEIIKQGKLNVLKHVNVKLQNKDMNRLEKYSKDKNKSTSETAGDFVLEGLNEANY